MEKKMASTHQIVERLWAPGKLAPYMFRTNDFRMQDRGSYGLNVIESEGKYSRKDKTYVAASGKTYQVFRDWSVKELVMA